MNKDQKLFWNILKEYPSEHEKGCHNCKYGGGFEKPNRRCSIDKGSGCWYSWTHDHERGMRIRPAIYVKRYWKWKYE